MKPRFALLSLLLAALILLLVMLPRQTCPDCGRPVYFLVLRFCGC